MESIVKPPRGRGMRSSRPGPIKHHPLIPAALQFDLEDDVDPPPMGQKTSAKTDLPLVAVGVPNAGRAAGPPRSSEELSRYFETMIKTGRYHMPIPNVKNQTPEERQPITFPTCCLCPDSKPTPHHNIAKMDRPIAKLNRHHKFRKNLRVLLAGVPWLREQRGVLDVTDAKCAQRTQTVLMEKVPGYRQLDISLDRDDFVPKLMAWRLGVGLDQVPPAVRDPHSRSIFYPYFRIYNSQTYAPTMELAKLLGCEMPQLKASGGRKRYKAMDVADWRPNDPKSHNVLDAWLPFTVPPELFDALIACKQSIELRKTAAETLLGAFMGPDIGLSEIPMPVLPPSDVTDLAEEAERRNFAHPTDTADDATSRPPPRALPDFPNAMTSAAMIILPPISSLPSFPPLATNIPNLPANLPILPPISSLPSLSAGGALITGPIQGIQGITPPHGMMMPALGACLPHAPDEETQAGDTDAAGEKRKAIKHQRDDEAPPSGGEDTRVVTADRATAVIPEGDHLQKEEDGEENTYGVRMGSKPDVSSPAQAPVGSLWGVGGIVRGGPEIQPLPVGMGDASAGLVDRLMSFLEGEEVVIESTPRKRPIRTAEAARFRGINHKKTTTPTPSRTHTHTLAKVRADRSDTAEEHHRKRGRPILYPVDVLHGSTANDDAPIETRGTDWTELMDFSGPADVGEVGMDDMGGWLPGGEDGDKGGQGATTAAVHVRVEANATTI